MPRAGSKQRAVASGGALGNGGPDGLESPAAERAASRSASDVLGSLDEMVRSGGIAALTPFPIGFRPLDRHLDGGIRPGELVLVGGAQGVGKTTFLLQMARNLTLNYQATCGYVCYEHDETYLLERLISLESLVGGGKIDAEGGLPVTKLRAALLAGGRYGGVLGADGLEGALEGLPAAATAVSRIRSFGQRLYLARASVATTDVPLLRQMVREWKEAHGPRVVLFVDYLQKVPVFPPPVNEADRVTRVTDALKELALSEGIPVVAVVAADREGLKAQRLRIHHLRGSSSLMYESDIVLILNNKHRIVAKGSVAYNPYRAREFLNWVVCTIEKNRSGLDLIDLEFRSWFPYAALDPDGGIVAEPLVDERIHEA